MTGWNRNDGRSTTERGYGWDWQKTRLRILKRDKRLCVPCKERGRVSIAKAVDHITPKAKGGTDDDSNLRSICDDCHKAKTAEDAGGKRKTGVAFNADGWPVWE